MKDIINVLIWSSTDPQKISLSIKAGVPFLIALFAMLNINVDINPLVDQLILVLNTLALLISGVFTLAGLLRKAYITIIGENKMLE